MHCASRELGDISSRQRDGAKSSTIYRLGLTPRERTKNGVTHVVPLSKPVRDLLRALLPENAKEARRVIDEKRARGHLCCRRGANRFSGWLSSCRRPRIVCKAANVSGTKANLSSLALVILMSSQQLARCCSASERRRRTSARPAPPRQ
jgi:hypothetical protein